MRCWVARAQTRITVVAGDCRPLVVVRRTTVMMVNVTVTTVRMHMDRGLPSEGPSHNDRNAGAEEPTHGRGLSQRGWLRHRKISASKAACLDISKDQPAILEPRVESPIRQNRRDRVLCRRNAGAVDATSGARARVVLWTGHRPPARHRGCGRTRWLHRSWRPPRCQDSGADVRRRASL